MIDVSKYTFEEKYSDAYINDQLQYFACDINKENKGAI